MGGSAGWTRLRSSPLEGALNADLGSLFCEHPCQADICYLGYTISAQQDCVALSHANISFLKLES